MLAHKDLLSFLSQEVSTFFLLNFVTDEMVSFLYYALL